MCARRMWTVLQISKIKLSCPHSILVLLALTGSRPKP